jgi:hypothetical protein
LHDAYLLTDLLLEGLEVNFSTLIDWAFFWKVFQNLLYSVMPFALIVVAIFCLGLLLGVVISSVRKASSKG